MSLTYQNTLIQPRKRQVDTLGRWWPKLNKDTVYLPEAHRRVHIIDPNNFECILIAGQKGYGKSALAELIAESLYDEGRIIIDAIAPAHSHEMLWWPLNDNKDEEMSVPLLIIGPKGLPIEYPDYCDVVVEAPPMNEYDLSQILFKAGREKRVVAFDASLFPSEVEAYDMLADWLEYIPKVQRFIRTDLVFLAREIGTYIYSRIKAPRVSKKLKTTLIAMTREVRSAGRMTMICDVQREKDVDASFRDQVDKIFFKRTRSRLLSDDMQWVHEEIEYNARRFRSNPESRHQFISLRKLDFGETYMVDLGEEDFAKIKIPLPRMHHHRDKRDELEDWGVTGIYEKPRPAATIREKREDLLTMLERKWGQINIRKLGQKERAELASDVRKANEHNGHKKIASVLGISHGTVSKLVSAP